MRRAALLVFSLFVCAWAGAVLAAEKQLIVIADEATYQGSADWTELLRKSGVAVKHVLPSQSAEYRKEKYIFLIGWPGEPGDAGRLVKEALKPDEVRWVEEQGNRKYYIKPDLWSAGQTVLVFAGSDREAALSAIRESKKAWWIQVASWFDLEVESKTLYGY